MNEINSSTLTIPSWYDTGWTPAPHLHPYQYFLFWSAGASWEYLQHCPRHEQFKYECIGALVSLTAFAALFSMFVAVRFAIPESPFWAILIAPVWALFIFFLDRFIVGSMSGIPSHRGRLLHVALRLSIAVLIALIVSRPLEMKIFETEIDKFLGSLQIQQEEEIEARKIELRQSESQRLDRGYASRLDVQKRALTSAEKEHSELAEKLASLDKEFVGYKIKMEQEQSGTGGSGIPSEGPLYAGYKNAADRLERQVIEVRKRLERAKIELDKQTMITIDLENLLRDQKAKLDDGIEKEHEETLNKLGLDRKGFLDRHRALTSLMNSDRTIWNVVVVVTLLFVLIEATPVLVKAMSPSGVYEQWLRSVVLGSENYNDAELRTQIHTKQEIWKKYYSSLLETFVSNLGEWTKLWVGMSAPRTNSYGRSDQVNYETKGETEFADRTEGSDYGVDGGTAEKGAPSRRKELGQSLRPSIVSRAMSSIISLPFITIVLATAAPLLWGRELGDCLMAGGLVTTLWSSKILLR